MILLFLLSIYTLSGRLVQNEDWRVFQHRTGDGNALHLTAREIYALGSHDRIHAARQLSKNIVALRVVQRPQDVFPGRIRLCHAHILQNRGFEQSGILKHKGHRVHQPILCDILYIHASNVHFAAVYIPKPCDYAGKRRYPPSEGPTRATCFPGFISILIPSSAFCDALG